jgi:hypothetical protein
VVLGFAGMLGGRRRMALGGGRRGVLDRAVRRRPRGSLRRNNSNKRKEN